MHPPAEQIQVGWQHSGLSPHGNGPVEFAPADPQQLWFWQMPPNGLGQQTSPRVGSQHCSAGSQHCQLARWLREARPALPIILYSAAVREIDDGGLALPFVPKPFDLDNLLALVAEQLPGALLAPSEVATEGTGTRPTA